MVEDQWNEYLRAKEPGVREKAYAWKTAIGLQKVDGLTPASFFAIHRKLFHGVLSHAGKMRDYNITKAEWVLLKRLKYF